MDDSFYRHEGVGHDFISTAAAAFIGAVIGHQIDTRTRLGHWVNNSPIADAFFGVVKLLAIIAAIGAVVLYFYLFFTAT